MIAIRCLIIDDEELARSLLENFVHRLPNLELVGMCKDPLEALSILQQEPIDLLFLDIQMPNLSGIELLASLKTPPMVIFTTAYRDFALKGYELDAVDYLLKPFGFQRFVQAVQKAANLFQLKSAAQNKPETSSEVLLVKAEHKIHRLSFDQILYIEGMREYVAFHLPERKILSLLSLRSLEEDLPKHLFLRIHKSYIAGIQYIRSMEGNQLLVGKTSLPIGASYKESVLRQVFS